MNRLLSLIRSDLLDFNPYRSARDEIKQGKIWLNANESPYDFELYTGIKVNRYPEKQPIKLIEKLANILSVDLNQIILACGSDEVINLLIRLFCMAGKDAIITCPPTYGMYSVYAQLQGAKVIEVPLIKENGFQLDLESILAKSNENVKIVFLCSPNNPTGNLLNKEDILYLCNKLANKCIIVVDQAYIDYADTPSLSCSIDQYDNLAILRTFSKAYGLAGARLGVLLSNQNIIRWLLKIIAPYPLSSLNTKLIIDALSSKRLLQIKKQIACIKVERKRLSEMLKKISFVKKIWPSSANYLLVEMEDSEKVMDECLKNGIILRSMFDKLGLKNCIRISVGLPEENDELIKILRQVKHQ